MLDAQPKELPRLRCGSSQAVEKLCFSDSDIKWDFKIAIFKKGAVIPVVAHSQKSGQKIKDNFLQNWEVTHDRENGVWQNCKSRYIGYT